MTTDLSHFAARLREFIHDSIPSELGTRNSERFSLLALDLFALQFTHNPAYRRFCEARRITPLTINRWTQIPAVPTAAFKELDLTCLSPGERTRVFNSSGTTEQRMSRHYHNTESLALYEASLWPWFEQHLRVTNPASRLICLTPPPGQTPHSSLVHMLDCIRRRAGAAADVFFGQTDPAEAWCVDPPAALAVLHAAGREQQPVALMGTAFSFVYLLDFMAGQEMRLALPAGSRAMETGGYKGRSRELPKAELHSLITRRLGIPPTQIICEYGMSELSSQAYDAFFDGARVEDSGSRQFHFPPWVRAQVVSPETGHEVADGETGLLRVFDLANVFSVMAIQTEDLAVRRAAGFELRGRATLAESRGCSLMTV